MKTSVARPGPLCFPISFYLWVDSELVPREDVLQTKFSNSMSGLCWSDCRVSSLHVKS